MNYFSFFDITIGVLAFSSIGIAVAFLTEFLGLFIVSGGTFARWGKHLYRHRSKVFSKDTVFKECLCRQKRKNSGILDFIAVLLLFLGYTLASYVVFEGVFRFVYLIPMLCSYFFALRFLVPVYRRIYLLLIQNVLAVASLFLSAPIFLLDRLLWVLKLPIRAIISVTYAVLLRVTAPSLNRIWKRELCLEAEEALRALL